MRVQGVVYESNYALKCYINALSNYGKEPKEGHLFSCGWMEDLRIAKNTLPLDAMGVSERTAWKTFIAENREIEPIHYPQVSLFNKEKHVSPAVPLAMMFGQGDKKRLLENSLMLITQMNLRT